MKKGHKENPTLITHIYTYKFTLHSLHELLTMFKHEYIIKMSKGH